MPWLPFVKIKTLYLLIYVDFFGFFFFLNSQQFCYICLVQFNSIPFNSIFISIIHITMKCIDNVQDNENVKMYNKEIRKK